MRALRLPVSLGLLLSAVALLTLGVPASASAAATARAGTATTKVLSCSGRPLVKPASYDMSCADANAWWKHVKWSSWGEKSALGHGYLYTNDCTPDCASGHFHSYAATIRLGTVRHSAKYGPLFSKATFSYRVKDKSRTQTFSLAT